MSNQDPVSYLTRALEISEKVLGPDHPAVAIMLKNYANLLRKMHREDKAAELEARARSIQANHAHGNPKP